jgi:quinol monooxygenase YgiN
MEQMAVIVDFELVEGRESEFAAIMRDHAQKTLTEEEGCLRFEIIKPVDENGAPLPNRIAVNELYRDWDAVLLHRRNPRIPDFSAAIELLVASRRTLRAAVR